MFFAFAQGCRRLNFRLAKRSFFLRAANGQRQSRELMLQDVVGYAELDALDGHFVAERSGQKDQRDPGGFP